MKKLFMILCAAALAFGCGDKITEDGGELTNETLSVSAETMVFSVGGDVVEGENAVTITSSSSWRLLGDKTWCTPSITEGASGAKVTFTAAPNTATEPRTIEFTFVCGDKAVKMAVTQKQSAVLDLITGSTVELGAGVSAFTIRAVANTDLTCYIPETSNWITQQDERTRAVEGAFLSFTVAANDSYEDRIGAVVLKVDGKETAVEVKQKQNDAIVLTKDSYEVPIAGGQVVIAFQKNVDYRTSIDLKYDWITPVQTRALVPGQAVFNVAPGVGTRVGQIKFTSASGQPLATAFVTQYGANRVYSDIPDANFRNWLKVNDFIIVPKTGITCELTHAGLTAETFNCNNKSIASFDGIEKFTAIKSFDCSYNTMTTIDVSKLTSLETFTCANNAPALTSVTLNAAIKTVTMSNASKLTSLDLSKCTALTTLTCSSNAVLASLDLSKCTALTTLTCSSNAALASLDLSNSKALTSLTCSSNKLLTSLDLSKCTALNLVMAASNNILKTLNITNCNALETLSVTSNVLLQSVNISGRTALKSVSLHGNTAMLSLDVNNCTALATLGFNESGVKTLNTTGATALKDITCSKSKIEAFDLSTNLELNKLVAFDTEITTLDVSNNTKLTYLDCDTNPQLLTLYLYQGQQAKLRTFYKDAGLQIIEK